MAATASAVHPHLSTLRRRIAKVPVDPGIYRWLNEEGEVIYVGKAKNLRKRLQSYVQQNAGEAAGPWKRSMIRQLADFDVTVVNSELEALILETNLIKEMRPKYNVLMKDDKNYVYVEVTVQDPYPKVEIVRQMRDKKARYFGPFLKAYETKRALDMLHELFSYHACNASVDALNRAGGEREAVFGTGKLRPCLDYQIGKCCGLCAGVVSEAQYRENIDQVLAFFRGDYEPVLRRGRDRMMQVAKERRFEKAKELRDMLAAIEEMQGRQLVSDTSGEDADVFGIALLSGKVQVVLFQKRDGKLIREEQFSLAGAAENIADALDQFLPQFYASAADIPAIVLVGEDFSERETLETFLTERRGKKVAVRVPERGKKSHLLELAERNAEEKAKQLEASWEADLRNTEEAMKELQNVLELPTLPARIEGYDISHLGGTETVGSMTVFVNGKPKNEHYRSFTIFTLPRGVIDDYRALKEVLTRRLRHVAGGIKTEEEKWKEGGVTFGKARKNEDETIRSIISRYPEELSQSDLDYKQFFVSRHEEEVVGFARLREHPGKLIELSSVWVDDRFRGQRLGQFLARLLLRSMKKGKVYVRVFPELEAYYAEIGFRHVLKNPQVFEDRWQEVKKMDPGAKERMVLVYDAEQHKPDVSLSAVPDLLVIDGGKGQLSAVVEVLRKMDLKIPVIGLAKREEEVFVPGKSVSIIFPKDSPAKFLLMRLRDEAHRFANRHRSRRIAKAAIASQLDSIPSIGPETRQELLTAFGSIDAIRRLPDEKLAAFLSAEQIGELRKVL